MTRHAFRFIRCGLCLIFAILSSSCSTSCPKDLNDYPLFIRLPLFLWAVGVPDAGLFSPVLFYGKVIDQNGDPVPNMRVSLTVETYTPMNPLAFYLMNPLVLNTMKRESETHTDSNGEFFYWGMGREFAVYIWPPEGYEHTEYSSSRHFYFGQEYFGPRHQIHKPDKNNPVIFRLRKKAPAVLSFSFMQELLGMDPDKVYYGDMFYHKSYMRSMELSELPNVDPEHYYPQVKVHQTYRKESENTHIFSLDVEFLENFQIQKGERDPLVVPEDGYAGKKFSATYKIILDPTPPRNHKEFLLSDDGKEWQPCEGCILPLYAKTDNNFYGYISLHWRPRRYLAESGFELAIKYRFNSVPDQRVFEDDSALHRELELKKWKKLEKKTQDEFFSGAKSLSEILENENSENDKNGK
ncbi:MAG: hypothetical protein J5944_13970 [Lentisphaeria bacterium]|nr:hypothetical protein [Lentisphaeria bacterium]